MTEARRARSMENRAVQEVKVIVCQMEFVVILVPVHLMTNVFEKQEIVYSLSHC